MVKVRQRQNIFDVSLQVYGSLDLVVKLCDDNSFNLDETPKAGQDVKFDPELGEKGVKIYTTENDHIFSNEAIEAKTALLAAENIRLSPKDDTIFIYK